MNEKPTINPQTLPPLTRFIYTLGQLPTSYLMSMTYEEQLVWLCNYLGTQVIPAVNQNGEAVEELQNLYELLRTYVNDYFDNLDVQEEINNKLDKMAEDGRLTALIKNYVDPYINEQNTRLNIMENNITNIDNKVNNVASGGPAGVYATKSALESADPDHTKIYLVSADNKWYYYDTGDSEWKAGSVYQSAVYYEDEIKPYQEEIIEKKNLFPYNNWIGGKTINTSGQVMDFATGSYCSTHVSLDEETKYTFVCSQSYSGKSMRIACYDENDTYISTINCYISNGSTCSVTTPTNTSYGLIHSFNLNFNEYYPSNYPYLIKFSDIDSLDEWTKPMYLKKEYQMINNSNVYCQDKIEWSLSNGDDGALPGLYTNMINKYTQHVEKTISTNDFSFFTFYIKNPVAGDKIRVKFTQPDSHLSSLGLYPYASQSLNTNFTYNSNKGEYEVVLTDSIIENYFNNGHARICTRITGITASTNINFTMQINANNLCNNFNDILNKINNIGENPTYKGIFLGDSITALTGDRSWITYFNEIIPMTSITNVAVAGATLMDKEGTIYDGNPVFDGPDHNVNNVLGNQVQKIINNNYDSPDFIIIAIGTNGGITFTNEDEIYNTYWNSNGSVKNLSSVDRKTSAGAFRYCNEKLHQLYPNAMIIWCTPIQANTNLKNVKSTITYGNNLKVLCSYGSNYYIDTEKCGILGINELNGSNGEDLIDGLHPNAHGAKKMGTFNACEFKKFLDKINL